MSDVSVVLRTADRTRKAEVTIPRNQRGGDLVQAALTNWALPADTEYSLVNATKGRVLHPDALLSDDQVSDKDELEIQPVLVAGASRECRA